jgi:GWxTD domain-containing protein
MRDMKHYAALALLAAGLCGGLLNPVSAADESEQSVSGEGIQPTFLIDAACFRGDKPDTNRLELYFQVFNFGLPFVKKGDIYSAEYTFTVAIEDNNHHQIKALEQDKVISAATYDETKSRFDFRTSQINFDLPPGTYYAKAALRDKQNRAMAENELKVKVPQFKSSFATLSDIEFAEAASERQGETTGVFNKNGLVVVPSVSRSFGGTEQSKLLYYVEVYPGKDTTERVLVQTIIRGRAKGMIYRDTLWVAPGAHGNNQLRDVSVGEFAPGDYVLEVHLLGRRNKELDSRTEELNIAWTQEALLRHDFKTAVDQLSYIATSKELEKIKKAESIEDRVAAFNAFWIDRDPTVGTPDNEAKREFYRRVNYANRQFGHLRREGWKTDRGRVYIMNGEPDQIDDYPMSLEYPPYQIWHYYLQGEYRRFLFIDENDDGDYRLEFPFDGLHQRPDF